MSLYARDKRMQKSLENKINIFLKKKCFLRQEKSCKTLKLIETFSNMGKRTSQMPFFGKLDIYGIKHRLIRYLWVLKLKIKYMPFPRFKEMIMVAHFY